MTELAIALDFPDSATADRLICDLGELPVIYKVGLELFLGAGPEWVKAHCTRGKRIFLDLKFYDIPNTVAAAVAQAASLGVEFTTVHLSGGRKMLDALKVAPKVLGVSVLTSFSEEDWYENSLRISERPHGIPQAVQNLAGLAAQHSAVFGMVCSAHEVKWIKGAYPNLYTVVPGIRPVGVPSQDQARVMTPKEAALAGASAIVVGRPITQSQDPKKIVEQILNDIG